MASCSCRGLARPPQSHARPHAATLVSRKASNGHGVSPEAPRDHKVSPKASWSHEVSPKASALPRGLAWGLTQLWGLTRGLRRSCRVGAMSVNERNHKFCSCRSVRHKILNYRTSKELEGKKERLRRWNRRREHNHIPNFVLHVPFQMIQFKHYIEQTKATKENKHYFNFVTYQGELNVHNHRHNWHNNIMKITYAERWVSSGIKF